MKRIGLCPTFWAVASVSAHLLGPAAWAEPDFSAEQRGAITEIQDDAGHKHWGVMGRIREEQSKMIELYRVEKRADSALNSLTPQIAELQQQIFEQALASRNQLDSLLTREQRYQLRQVGSRVDQVRR